MRKAILLLILGIILALSSGAVTKEIVFPTIAPGSKLQPLSKQEITAKFQEKNPSFTIENISNSWGPVSSDTTTVITQMLVGGLDLSKASVSIFCSIYMNEVKMFEGQVEDFTIEKKEKGSLVRFATQINNNSQTINKWWNSHIRNGEKTKAKIKGELKINLEEDNLVCPFLWENEFQTNILEGVNTEDVRSLRFGFYTLEIKSLHSEWGKITPNYTKIKHTLKIHNPSVIPGALIVNRLEYELSLNGIKMTEGGMGLPLVIWPKETRELPFTSTLNSEKIRQWWVSHIKSDEKSTYKLKYTLFIKFFGATLARWPEEIEGAFSTDFLGRK